ncbi:hypothetical protein BCD67_21540 [Oscillatoriales cyanobacterium USR001]|nr:hypothetical protein BCD67_21540 [Oscillatoriales cyanobacterium USR001]
MSEKDRVVFQVNQSLFEQLTEWQAKMEAADNQLADESDSEESTPVETHANTHANTHENQSKTNNS